jgi:hypothetical protein
MDRINHATILENILLHHKNHSSDTELLEHQTIIDHSNGHYQLLSVGWENNTRVCHVLIHVDIKDNKIWIQQDYTVPSVTEWLLEAGVSKSEIVLGFVPPAMRADTGYAVA